MSAIAAFEHMLELNPKSADAHFWLGLTKYTWGDERENRDLPWDLWRAKLALKDVNAAIELDPQHAGAYYLRATVYRRFERYAAAIEDLTAAIKRALPSQRYPEYGAILYSPPKRLHRVPSDIPDELIAVSLKAAAYAQRAQCQFEQRDKAELRFSDLDEASRLIPKEPKLSQLRALLQ